MGWRIVEVETDEYLQLYLNNLLIKRLSEKIVINISDIDVLILHNDRTTISIKLINALTSAKVNIILMNHNHIPSSYILPVSGNISSFKVFNQQLKWKKVYKSSCWVSIIRNKLFNQMRLLEKNNKLKNKEFFTDLINNIKEFDISNREGHGAKVYWRSLFGNDFVRDQNCHKSSVINSMLNYGYALLRSITINAIYKSGLDPRISFFHKSHSNFFALASDIMEPFRILIDEIVYNFRDAKIFTIEIRSELLKIFDKKITVGKNKFYINRAIDKVVASIAKEQGWITVDLWD